MHVANLTKIHFVGPDDMVAPLADACGDCAVVTHPDEDSMLAAAAEDNAAPCSHQQTFSELPRTDKTNSTIPRFYARRFDEQDSKTHAPGNDAAVLIADQDCRRKSSVPTCRTNLPPWVASQGHSKTASLDLNTTLQDTQKNTTAHGSPMQNIRYCVPLKF